MIPISSIWDSPIPYSHYSWKGIFLKLYNDKYPISQSMISFVYLFYINFVLGSHFHLKYLMIYPSSLILVFPIFHSEYVRLQCQIMNIKIKWVHSIMGVYILIVTHSTHHQIYINLNYIIFTKRKSMKMRPIDSCEQFEFI